MLPVYIILGAAGSGRREIVANILAEESAEAAACLISEEERPSDWDELLHSQSHTTVVNWRFEGNRRINSEPIPADTGYVVFLTDGRKDPVDQIDALLSWLGDHDLALGRIITVVHCFLLHSHPNFRGWFEACIHFSDLVLLNRRSGIPGGWIREFTGYFEKACYPCLFENVRNGRVANSAQALYPEARRLSLVFDELDASAEGENADVEIEGDFAALDDRELDEHSAVDPYLETLPNGRRARPLPDIREFLAEGEK